MPKLSALPAGSALDGTEIVPLDQGGDTKRTTTQAIANLGSGMANPMTTAGDMIIGGASGVPARFAAPTTGTTWSLTYVVGTGYVWSSSAATSAYDWIVALGDETTAITTGTAKVTVRAPRAMTLSKIKASLTAASSSGNPTFDVKKNGTSVFSTTLSIDASEKTSETATTAAVLSTTSIAADDELTFDITVAGTGAAGAKITLVATA